MRRLMRGSQDSSGRSWGSSTIHLRVFRDLRWLLLDEAQLNGPLLKVF